MPNRSRYSWNSVFDTALFEEIATPHRTFGAFNVRFLSASYGGGAERVAVSQRSADSVGRRGI